MTRPAIILFYPAPWPTEARGRIPYALLYLERAVRDLEVDVILIDEQHDGDYVDRIEAVGERLLLVGVSAMTGEQIRGGAAFSREVKRRTDVPLVWGGWHPTLLPEQTLAEHYVDIVVVGQGEVSFRELVSTLLAGGDPGGIAGIAYKDQGSVRVNPPRRPVDPSAFEPVDFGRVKLERYIHRTGYASRCIGYFTSHGCPLDCAFCCVKCVYHRRWFPKRIARIIDDLRLLKQRGNIDSVTFDDDNFFINRSHVLALCRALIDADLGLLWDTSAHASLFLRSYSDSDMAMIVEAGCRQVYIGAESGDQRVLDLIDKKSTVDENVRFVSLLERHGVIPVFSCMVGLPGVSTDEAARTFAMIRKAILLDRTLRVRVFLYTPYPGTDLYNRALKAGFVPPARLEAWANHTLRRFRAPWTPTDLRRRLEVFVNFYVALMNPRLYRLAPSLATRIVVYAMGMLFRPLVSLRFRYNCFSRPLEAVVFLSLLALYNRLTAKRYCLGYESYLQEGREVLRR